MAYERKFRVIQLDECLITKNTLPTHAWTLPKTNIRIDQRESYTKAKAIIVAVSREKGLDYI